jgi:hypothetical protein
MISKLILALSVSVVFSAAVYAQGAPQQNAPKPTRAAVQKVVQIISTDKAKTAAYCQMAMINDQMAEANEKKDQKALERLSAQADQLADKLGPEYIDVMQGLDQVDENSPEGKQFAALFEQLDKLCTGR